MVSDNDDNIPTNISNSNINSEFKLTNIQQTKSSKTSRTGLFAGSIFTRVSKKNMIPVCQYDR